MAQVRYYVARSKSKWLGQVMGTLAFMSVMVLFIGAVIWGILRVYLGIHALIGRI